MQHDESEDEFGFWEPAPRRHVLRRRTDGGDTLSASDAEPTRQLQRIDPGRRIDHTAELRRLRVSGGSEAIQLDPPRRHGQIPAASLVGEPQAMAATEVVRYLDGDLDDEHYFDADDVGTVSLVASGGRSRRTWRTLLMRDERGRFDPLVTRLSAIALVGSVALGVCVAMNTSPRDPLGSATVRPAAVRPSAIGAAQPETSSIDVPASPVPEPSIAGPDVQDSAGAPSTAIPPAPSAADRPASPVETAVASRPAPGAANTVSTAAVATQAPKSAASAAGTAKSLAAPSACGPAYTIAAGDYWIGIADRAHVPLTDLLEANSAESATALFPGRTICLPAGTEPLAPATKVTTTTSSTETSAPAPTTAAPAATPPATTSPATTSPPVTTPVTTPASTKPTTSPTTQPPPPTTTPARTYTRSEVEQIIRDTWPDDQEDRAVEIATRESNLVPGVRNYCCYGLFQIYYDVHRSWLNQMGVTSAEQLFDPAVNARAALALYNRSGGWGPWAL